ncbi:hypothetical protein MferCBS49748_003653 [Microsporum ferrugineum]
MSSSSQESSQALPEDAERDISMGDGIAGPSSSRDGPLDQTPSPGADYLLQRRHRKQASSTFRLESPAGPSSSPWRSVSRWGKEPVRHQSDDSELFVPKRNSQQRRQLHTPKPSIGSSPLSNVVSNEENDQKDAPYTPGSSSHAHPRTSSSVGLDTDPAQIVNLALSLSDSRKRSSSIRTSSGGAQRPRLSSSVVHSRPQGINSTRQAEIETPSRGPPTPQETVDLRYGATHYGEVQFSEATLARAEKAKQHFELFEHYLRLLPHLPPLPSSGDGNRRFQNTREDEMDASEGRKYNPLQYLRNRKVRFRERQVINSEAAGWGDVQKVTEWVNSITEMPSLRLRQPNDYISLPPFNPNAARADTEDKPDKNLTPTRSGDIVRRRPRMDWNTTPLDLLADVVWYEQDDNKAKVEDRNGKRLFPHGIKVRSEPDTSAKQLGSLDSTKETNENAKFEQSIEDIKPLPTFTSAGGRGQQNVERGRLRDRFAQSINLTPSHSRLRKQSRSPVKKRPRSSSDLSRHSYGSNQGGNSAERYSISDAKNREPNDNDKQTSSSNGAPNNPRPVTPNQVAFGSENTPGTHTRQPYTPKNMPIPPLDTELNSYMSPRPGYAASTSSMASDSGIPGSRGTPIHDDNSPFHTSAQRGLFPSMGINLSPLRGRSTSPGRRHPFYLGHSRKSSRQKQGQSLDPLDSSADLGAPLSHRHTTSNLSPPGSPFTPEDQKTSSFRRSDSSPAKNTRNGGQQEWKRILKGGRIAELVGSEVSRVGDLIWKREHQGHSRQSSASSLSEYIDAETVPGDPKLSMEDDLFGDATQRVNTYDFAAQRVPPPAVTSTSRRGALNNGNDPIEDEPLSRNPDAKKDKPLHGPLATWDSSTQTRLDNITRKWALSTRNIPHSGRIGKRDISRVRTHLLSSGIKAVEICRYAEKPAESCVDSWLNAPVTYNSIAPYIASSEASALASRKSISAFNERTSAYNLLIREFVDSKAPPLKSEIRRLERLVSSTLTPRIRELTTQAETLTSDLGTASTLPVKKLENILNKGLRKRNRRIRSIIKLLSAVFEWLLMGLFWVLWISVMIWKIIRLIGLSTFRCIRWVLWL